MIVIGSSLQGIRTSCQENGSAESQLGPTGNNILAMYNSAKKKPPTFLCPPGPQIFKVASRTSRSINRCTNKSSPDFPAIFEATLNIGVRGGGFYFAEPGLRYQRFLDFSKTECKRAQDQGVVLMRGLRGA